MAVPVIASSSTVSPAATDPVLTKPAGLAEGDLLLAFIFTGRAGSAIGACATPSGWTLEIDAFYDGASDTHRVDIFSKIATSADVAASNFTFNCENNDLAQNSGVLCRITGSYTTNPVDFAVYDDNGSGFNPTVTLSGANIRTPDTLLFMVWFSANVDAGSNSFSNYNVTGITNPTWTELIDFDGGTATSGALAYATSGALGTVTQIEVDEADGGIDQLIGMLVGLSPQTNATGTNALLSVSPTTFSQSGTSGTTGTNALHAVSPTLNTQSGAGYAPTQWTTSPKS